MPQAPTLDYHLVTFMRLNAKFFGRHRFYLFFIKLDSANHISIDHALIRWVFHQFNHAANVRETLLNKCK